MKALTDKIVEALEERLKKELCSTNEYWYKCAIHDAISIIKEIEKNAEYEEVVRVVMKHLGNPELYHPHYTIIITNATAELVEGKRSIGHILDYVPD